MADPVLGMNAQLFYGTSGTRALNEMTNVREVTITMSAGEADVTTRANNGWRATQATLREATVEFEMMWLEDDAGFIAIKNAFLASGQIALLALSGDGGEGIDGDFSITNFTRSEPLEEAQSVSVTAKLVTFRSWYGGAS